MKSLIRRMLVSGAIALVSLASTGPAMAQTPHALYKDLIRPNGQMRSYAVHQADVNACYAQTGASRYLPDNAAMKKCMLGRGYQFVSQGGFGSSSGRTVARSGSSDDDYSLQQTLQNNHNADQQLQQQNDWALQQQMIDQENQEAQETAQEANDMAASQAAADAQNAAAEDMINQDTMNQLNN